MVTKKREQATAVAKSEQELDKVVEDSFPASDPPSTGGVTRLEPERAAGNPPSVEAPPACAEGSDAEESIRKLAYELWQADGSPAGQSEKYWHQARQKIRETS